MWLFDKKCGIKRGNVLDVVMIRLQERCPQL